MVEIYRTNTCCGVREIGGLDEDSPRGIIAAVNYAIRSENKNGAFFWFANPISSRYGKRLAAYIKKHALGPIKKMGPKYNPQSRRQLEMWIWEVDQEAIRAHDEKQPVDDDEDPLEDA